MNMTSYSQDLIFEAIIVIALSDGKIVLFSLCITKKVQ